jgi:DNA-binding Lrp family transcriptional regulator
MTDFDDQLLNLLQKSVPLAARPFDEIAATLQTAPSAVLQAVARLRQNGVIRRISGIFDAPRLGYRQTLVAMTVPPDQLDHAGQIVAGHPGVSHCYARGVGRAYLPDVPLIPNLWFTLALSPLSRLDLENTVTILAKLAGSTQYMLLPSLRRYKLQVHIGRMSGGGMPVRAMSSPVRSGPGATPSPPSGEGVPPETPPLSPQELRAIAALSSDLPAIEEPFAALASAQSMTAAELLARANDFLAKGYMRRYAAVLEHRLAGAAANVMVVWRVSDRQADQAGQLCARLHQVSHCYLRQAASNWPYTLYTMIHGPNEQDCAMTIDEIITTTGLQDHVRLWTVKEYKKEPTKLFDEQEGAWENANARQGEGEKGRGGDGDA